MADNFGEGRKEFFVNKNSCGLIDGMVLMCWWFAEIVVLGCRKNGYF
jgi:hypothetical protein